MVLGSSLVMLSGCISVGGWQKAPRLHVHGCVAAVEQREAFGVMELAGEDYVGVSTVSEMEFEKFQGMRDSSYPQRQRK